MYEIKNNPQNQKTSVAWRIRGRYKFLFFKGSFDTIKVFYNEQNVMQMVRSGEAAMKIVEQYGRKLLPHTVISIQPGWYSGQEFIPSFAELDVQKYLSTQKTGA